MKHIQFFLILGILFSVSCSKPTPVPVEAIVIPTPLPEPEVDTTFSDKQAVETWRTEFAKRVDERVALPSPEKILAYAKDFKVDSTKPDPFIGDPTVWNANWTYLSASYAAPAQTKKEKPNVEEAKALEAANRHWDAAQIWIQLGKMEDANRCSKKLAKKGEWKAVALIAVLTGDLASLSSATTKMVKARQVSRTKDVVYFAIEKDKMHAARHICNIHSWQLENILSENEIRTLARRGDPSLIPSLIQRGLKNWERQQYDRDSDDLVADIMTFAKSNPKEAKLYASRYLKLLQANVLIWVSCGEGCYNTPIRGSLELYQLIKDDPSLREIYFERTRQFINEAFPLTQGDTSIEVVKTIAGEHVGNMDGWSTDMWGNMSTFNDVGNLLFTYLLNVSRVNDHYLKDFWVQLMDTFPKRHGMDRVLAFEREIGRFILGLSVNVKADGLTPEESVILDVFQGHPAPDLVNLYKVRPIASEEYRKKLPDVKSLFAFLTRGDVSPAREAQIRTELSIDQATPESNHLRFILRGKLEELMPTRQDDMAWMRSVFSKLEEALWTNMRAQKERAERNLLAIQLYPDTPEEFEEIIAPSLILLGEKLPSILELYREEHPKTESLTQP